MTDFPPPNERSDQLASIGRRALAQFLDNVLVQLPLALILLAVGFDGASVFPTENSDSSGRDLLFLSFIVLIVMATYNTTMIALRGDTFGKRIMKIRVVNRIDGSRVGWSYAAVRALVPAAASAIPHIGPAVSLAVYVRAFFHPYRQGLHDAAAGTVVVRV